LAPPEIFLTPWLCWAGYGPAAYHFEFKLYPIADLAFSIVHSQMIQYNHDRLRPLSLDLPLLLLGSTHFFK